MGHDEMDLSSVTQLFNLLESKKLQMWLVRVTLMKSLRFHESALPYLLNRNAKVLPIIIHF